MMAAQPCEYTNNTHTKGMVCGMWIISQLKKTVIPVNKLFFNRPIILPESKNGTAVTVAVKWMETQY